MSASSSLLFWSALTVVILLQLSSIQAFAPLPRHASLQQQVLESSRLFGLEEDLEGEPDEASANLAAEFYELERGKSLTPKDIEDLENDDLDPQNLVVREDIDEFGNKIVDYEYSEEEDYSDNRSIEE